MYKVYLSPSTQDKSFGIGDYGSEAFRMREIAKKVEKELLKTGEIIVYKNSENMKKEEIINECNSINPEIHVAIHTNYGNKKGIESYTKVGCEKSNGFAKEIYKELYNIYYDKSIDNGVIYDKEIIEITKVNCPGVLIEVGCHENIEDVNWIIANTDNIAHAIAEGIKKGFELKPC